jgi:hypothetical protein
VGLEWYQLPALSLVFQRLNFFNLKEHYPKKYIEPVSVFNGYANKVCMISVVPAANSVYWWANFNILIYTRKSISGHSSIPVVSVLWSVVQKLLCPLLICGGALKSGM